VTTPPPRPPSTRALRNRIILAVAAAAVLAVALIAGMISARPAPAPATTAPAATPTSTPTPTPGARPQPTRTPGAEAVDTFDKNARSIDDPASIWVVVNKQRPLNPLDYVPADLVDVPVDHTWAPVLRKEASDAVVAMFTAAAQEAGLELASNSAYRSYSSQVEVYTDDVEHNGQAAADLSTARPGYSEHQTGLTMDIGPSSGNCSLNTCLADTPEGQWLAANGWRFGFILRYPADKTEITGYDFEPRHYRYVGVELSTRMHETGVRTLEEFFGLPAAPTY